MMQGFYSQGKDWLTLCKPNLVLMVVFTALSGYFIAEPLVIEWQVLGLIFGGVFLSGCGAHILNQYYEREIDSLMTRTKNRPLPLKKNQTQHLPFYNQRLRYKITTQSGKHNHQH